jgi:triosephosphate isomerase (TIM)
MSHTPLIIGNWKANPLTEVQAMSLVSELKKAIPKKHQNTVVIAPPYPFVPTVGKDMVKTDWALGAQNVLEEIGGAHTGEVSLSMLQSIGVQYYLLGHSERRARGETDVLVTKKLALVLKHRAQAVVCVGERDRDKRGDYLDEVKAQVEAICSVVTPATIKFLTIAYEPIWAIGTGKNATPRDALEMKLFIQKVIADALGRTAVKKVRILYGGSVKAQNAQALFTEGEVDGFLVGGASLVASEFGAIVKVAER